LTGSRRSGPARIASTTPFSTAGMNDVGMTPPFDVVDEFKARPGLARGDLDVAVAELPAAADCFLWRPWALAGLRIVSC